MHCHPGFGWNTPASIARTSATSRNSRTFNFSPSTNLLPIRQLDLAIGQEAAVQAAWLRFPSFTLEPLDQLYRRIYFATYRYESVGGRFVTELQVNPVGLVTRYPNFWHVEAGS